MDTPRFDALSRSLATRRSVARLGGGGLLAALFAALGLRDLDAAAATCSAELVGAVRVGPSTGAALGGKQPGELRGTLTFALTKSGRVTGGRLALPDGSALDVSGQANGQAVTLRARVPLGGTLVLVGAGARAITACAGAWDGVLTGPAAGDLGDWHATATPLQGATPAPTAATIAVSTAAPATGSGGAGDEGTGTGGSGGADTGGGGSEPSAPTEMPTVPSAPGCVPEGGDCETSDLCCTGVCDYGPGETSQHCHCIPVGKGGCAANSHCCDGGVCLAQECFPACYGSNEECGPTGCCAGLYCHEASGLCRDCVLNGEDCSVFPCCVGTCSQDKVCQCAGPGEQCMSVGTGGCCDGQGCGADGNCP